MFFLYAIHTSTFPKSLKVDPFQQSFGGSKTLRFFGSVKNKFTSATVSLGQMNLPKREDKLTNLLTKVLVEYLEDHPRTCKCLSTMVNKSPKDRVVGPFTNGRNHSMAAETNGGPILITEPSPGMIQADAPKPYI